MWGGLAAGTQNIRVVEMAVVTVEVTALLILLLVVVVIAAVVVAVGVVAAVSVVGCCCCRCRCGGSCCRYGTKNNGTGHPALAEDRQNKNNVATTLFNDR